MSDVRIETLLQSDLHLVGDMAEIMPGSVCRYLSTESTGRVLGGLPEGSRNGSGGEGGSLGETEEGLIT